MQMNNLQASGWWHHCSVFVYQGQWQIQSKEVEELTKQVKKPEAAIGIVKEVEPAKLETIDDWKS